MTGAVSRRRDAGMLTHIMTFAHKHSPHSHRQVPMVRSVRSVFLSALLLPSLLQAQQAAPLDRANLDTTCAPCADFFGYANGGWIARTQIPADHPSWGSFNELQEANYAALEGVLTDAAAGAATATDPNQKKLGLFFGSCMDSALAEREGARPLQPELARIAAIRDRPGIQAEIARLALVGVTAPFDFHSTPDAKNSSRVIAELYQSGLTLPDRDYYTKDDSASVSLREQYVDHVQRILRLLGDDSTAAVRQSGTVLSFETTLAQSSMTRVEQRNPDSLYNLLPAAGLARLTPGIGWPRFYRAVGLGAVGEVNVAQPRFMATVDSLLTRASLADWRTYLRWRLLTASAFALSTPFVQENFRFKSGVLTGVTEMRPRWKRCLDRTDQTMGEILGQAYVARRFTPDAKARALTMVRNIQAEFRRRIDSLPWMSAATKARAHVKLDAIINKIGFPDHWRDYSRLQIPGGVFLPNYQRAVEFEARRDLGKIGKPLDRAEWGMTPPTVNAYYNPRINEIVFPAGIMQPPFFNPDADDAVNYGGMGAAIGHELTHGFDDEGRKFDAAGNLTDWWTAEDAQAFAQRAEVVTRQFNGYVAVDTQHVNGKLTLGENIADLGGVAVAYAAFRRTLEGKPEPAPIDGFTADQRFFLAWAQIWRGADRPEYARLLVNVDPHSPARWRVNGPLSNIPAFTAAFGCRKGDVMLREERAEIW